MWGFLSLRVSTTHLAPLPWIRSTSTAVMSIKSTFCVQRSQNSQRKKGMSQGMITKNTSRSVQKRLASRTNSRNLSSQKRKRATSRNISRKNHSFRSSKSAVLKFQRKTHPPLTLSIYLIRQASRPRLPKLRRSPTTASQALMCPHPLLQPRCRLEQTNRHSKLQRPRLRPFPQQESSAGLTCTWISCGKGGASTTIRSMLAEVMQHDRADLDFLLLARLDIPLLLLEVNEPALPVSTPEALLWLACAAYTMYTCSQRSSRTVGVCTYAYVYVLMSPSSIWRGLLQPLN